MLESPLATSTHARTHNIRWPQAHTHARTTYIYVCIAEYIALYLTNKYIYIYIYVYIYIYMATENTNTS